MALPREAWAPVADSAAELLFRRLHGDRNQIDLRTKADGSGARPKTTQIKSDAPGTSKQSFGFGAPAFDETDFHQADKDRWAKDAADELSRARSGKISKRWRRSPRRGR